MERYQMNDLALSWDLPPLTTENRKWLAEKNLQHAVFSIVMYLCVQCNIEWEGMEAGQVFILKHNLSISISAIFIFD